MDQENNELLSNFVSESLTKLNQPDVFLQAKHIDELGIKMPGDAESQIEMSFKIYEKVLKLYQSKSNDVMAMLAITVGQSETLRTYKIEELLSGKLDLNIMPPEIYLIKRWKNDEPYVVEEYKVPIRQDIFKVDKGCVYAYYKSNRNEPDDTYSEGFYFEHYPLGVAQHSW